MSIIMWTFDICFANFYLNFNRTKNILENNLFKKNQISIKNN